MEHTAATWNSAHPVGKHVHVRLDDGTDLSTTTRSEAWELGDGTPVVLISGRSGGYLLSRVRVCGAFYPAPAKEGEGA